MQPTLARALVTLAAILVPASIYVACALNAQASDCPNYGPICAGCDSGETECQATSQSACEGTETKPGQKKKALSSGPFECGFVEGSLDCRTSPDTKQLCYTTWNCKWSSGACVPDDDSIQEVENWIKEGLDCYSE